MVKASPPSAGDASFIPGRGTKIPRDSWPKNPKHKKQYCNKFNKDFKKLTGHRSVNFANIMIMRKFECCQNYLLQWFSSKESTCNAGTREDMCSIPGSGRYLGGGHGNPLQYSCLKNPMDSDTWQATVHRVAKSWAQ